MHQNKQKQQYLDQASHNESACDYLHKDNRFLDWVVTSAFYTALHYVYSKIFPLSFAKGERVLTANNIGEFCRLKSIIISKHQVMTDLVYENCKGIGNSYKRLLDLSYLTRYEVGCQNPEYAAQARRFMSQIKAHCNPQKTIVVKVPDPASA